MKGLDTLLDHTTDIAAIAAIAAIALYGMSPSPELLGALVSIALGAKYMAGRKVE